MGQGHTGRGVRIRGYREGDLEDLVRAHGVVGGDADHLRWYYLENPRVDLDLVCVAEVADRVRSTARIVPLEVYVDGNVVPVGGIATVATHAAYRRRGLAGVLARHALYELRGRGIRLSLLHPFAHAFYRRYGFELGTEGIEYILKPTDLPTSPEQERVRARVPADLPPMMALQDEQVASHPCCVRRSEEWWRLVLDLEGEKAADYGHRAAVYERGGRLEGYVLYRHSGRDEGRTPPRTLRVSEVVARSPRARRGLLSFLAAHDPRAFEIRHETSRAEPLHPYLRNSRVEARVEPGFMLRLVDVEGALGLVGREIEAPLCLEVADSVIAENAGAYTVVGVGQVVRGTESAERVRVDVRQLAQLYAGYLSAGELYRNGMLGASSETALRLLEGLFPRADPWLFPVDHF